MFGCSCMGVIVHMGIICWPVCTRAHRWGRVHVWVSMHGCDCAHGHHLLASLYTCTQVGKCAEVGVQLLLTCVVPLLPYTLQGHEHICSLGGTFTSHLARTGACFSI